MVRLRPVWMTNHPPNLYCVGADVKPCSINQHFEAPTGGTR